MKQIKYNQHLKTNLYNLNYDISCQIQYIDNIYNDVSFETHIQQELKRNIIHINNKIN